MNRKNFLKRGALLVGSGLALPNIIRSSSESLTQTDVQENVGFNHLPNREEKKMKTVIHRASTRGFADHGWLKANHTFSFANYRNPERMHFGVLRVLNDDYIEGGGGFGTHPHDNMEIITIPLSGTLEHKDSMGNTGIIKKNEIQVMSAGTGIFHSEYNATRDKALQLLQIWLFPNKRQVTPRYDQLQLNPADRKNTFQQVLSPSSEDEGVWIYQNAWFHLIDLDSGKEGKYTLKDNENGVYVFVISGEIEVNGEKLSTRDGMGVWETDELIVQANKNAEVLLMEVPMQLN